MKHRFKKDIPLLPVLKPTIGTKYHVSWAYNRGVVGICISVDEQDKTVILKRPKGKELFKHPVKWSDLRHTRKQQVKINRHGNNKGTTST